ncbi:MAG: hypothetical protein O7E52_07235, partial [Candidatus Poribacteria bacterium]|nr:hypothetical protein [Candidatus Poribacteria bacterium]
TTKLRDWLIAHGPLKRVEAQLVAAKTAQESGQLGLAFTRYNQVSKILPDHPLCIEAAGSAENLAQQAEAQLAEVETALAHKPYPEVVKQLNQIAKVYAGSIFADNARQSLKDLLNTKADALEARARAAKEAKDYTQALQLYKLYLTYFSESYRYPMVKAHLKALKANLQQREAN